MPECQFNEREFEAALNHELIGRWQPYLLGALPRLPSQFAEKALGYDAAYEFKSGKRIFLQYKVAFAAIARTPTNRDLFDAWEGPYLRAALLLEKKTRMPHQHNLLVRLAASGEEVYYCAPLFHKLPALARHSQSKTLWANSLRAPLRGAPQLGRGRHSFSYISSGSRWRLHSEIGEERDAINGEADVPLPASRPFNRETFAGLLAQLRGLLEAPPSVETPKFIEELGPLAELDWLLCRHLGTVLMLLPDREKQ